MAISPISPSDVTSYKLASFPNCVIETWNKAIVEAWDGNSSQVIQTEIADKLASLLDTTRANIFTSGYLEIEDIYRKAGWKVTYDKPAYCESYAAYFLFSK